MITPYPLNWPMGKPRSGERIHNKDLTRQIQAAKDLIGSCLDKIGATAVVISTNARTTAENPKDPGVAIWFVLEGDLRSVAVDGYATLQQNLAGAAATIDYLYRIRKHGGLELFSQAMKGFKSLPAPVGAQGSRTWRDVLQVGQNAELDVIEATYRLLAKRMHPDRGGTNEAMAELNAAYAEAKKELGA